MKFLYPNFLWALFFLAVPIIIHLFHFRRYQRVLFSNTQFLAELKDEQATKNKLKHLLVLLIRLLAILFLVLAFAQPFIPKNKETSQELKAVSIYLDNSFSMQAEGNGYILFDEAKTTAERIIEGYGENNRFHLITNDFEAKHQRLLDKSACLNQLEQVSISPASQQKNLVLDKQKNILKDFQGIKHIYHLSDFQRSNELFNPDSSFNLNVVKFTPSNIRNLSVETVYFENPVQLIGQQNKLIVKFRNQSEEEQIGSFQLAINGETKSVGSYKIAGNAETFDTIVFTINDVGWNEGRLSLNDYPLNFDDDFFFTFLVEGQLNVYTIFEEDGNKYPLAVFSDNILVSYSSDLVNAVDYRKISEQQVIILSNLKSIPSGLADLLKDYVETGGQLFIIPHNRIEFNSYNLLFASLNAGKVLDRVESPRKVSSANFNHSIFEDIFQETPTDLTLPKVKLHYEFAGGIDQELVMSFSDGLPFLSSVTYGQGTSYFLSSPLGEGYSDFTQQAVFAPICFRMAVLGAKSVYTNYTIQAQTKLTLNEMPESSESILRMGNNKTERIPSKSILNGNMVLSLPGADLENGFYELRDDANELLAKMALNYGRIEGDLDFYSLEELNDFYANSSVNILSNNLAQIKEHVKQMEDGQSFWKLCVILALVFLALEILILRFLPS